MNQTIKHLEQESKVLLSDKDIAKLISISPSWIRRQRFLRKKGEDHVLTIDPIYIGSSPRYTKSEILSWLEEL